MDDSIFDLWRHLLTETTSGLFLELLVRASMLRWAPKTKLAIKVVEKQQILLFFKLSSSK